MLSRAAPGVVHWKNKSQQTQVAAGEIPIQYQAKKRNFSESGQLWGWELGVGNSASCGLSVLVQLHLCNPKVLKQLTLLVKLKVASKLALLQAGV